ncbi:MAG: N-acetyltransferase family protein [Myxococcaceae bacterium]
MTLLVRQATDKDLPRLLPMMVDFNRLESIAWTFERGESALRSLLGNAELGLVGLAEVDEVTSGYFVLTFGYDLEWNGRDAFLTELYLVPEARGRGLGRALLSAAEASAEARGTRALHLMVRPENAPALALYLKTGFREPARRLLTKPLLGADR